MSRSRFWFMTLVLLGGPAWPVWGQSAVWQPPGATSGSIYYNGGNVGIGTPSPVSPLQVQGGVAVGSGAYNTAGSGYGLSAAGWAGKNSSFDANIFALFSNDALGGNPLSLSASVVGSTVATERYAYLQAGEYGTGSWRTLALNPNGGNVGIGTAAPVSRLDLKGGNLRISRTADANGYVFQNADNGERLNVGYMTSSDSSWLGAPILTMLYTGNVGIGTTAPQYKLAVNGVIGAKDVMVTSTGWPDYVFQPGYRLRPLREVGEFIAANRHLPDIPPAAEVESRGVSVGEMQAKLLAKIEELTLHLIRQEKESEELRERLRKLEKLAAER